MKRVDCLFVFHFHLPYLYHHDGRYIEENWYYQNLAEAYIPFLEMIEELAFAGLVPQITVSLSPTLYNMMENEVMSARFKRYLERTLSLIDQEKKNNSEQRIKEILTLYEEKYLKVMEYFTRYSEDIITPFKILKNQGVVEIITSPLSYSILPLITLKEVINVEISEALKDFKNIFLTESRGFFISECAWSPQIESFLKKNSVEYIFLDERASDVEPSKMYILPSGIKVFLRDYRSFDFIFGEEGVVRNPFYREFYRDIGYERDLEYLKRFTECDFPVNTGIKYFRITDLNLPLEKKELYDPQKAHEAVLADAERFARYILDIFSTTDNKPLFVGIFNAEIFGHRWFEGIEFWRHFFITIRQKRYPIGFVLPTNYINTTTPVAKITPTMSSWADNGFFDKWLNEKNDFIYPFQYEISKKFISVASRFRGIKISGELERVLKAIAREIVMMHSSDWAVMIASDVHKEYAGRRIAKHYSNAVKLIDWLIKGYYDKDELALIEKELPVFSDIDWRSFLSASVM